MFVGQVITMRHGQEARGTRSAWRGIIVLLAAMLLASQHGRKAQGLPHPRLRRNTERAMVSTG